MEMMQWSSYSNQNEPKENPENRILIYYVMKSSKSRVITLHLVAAEHEQTEVVFSV